MNDDLARMLYEGALAVKQGRTAEGRALLMQVLERDEQSELAWLWLSGAVDDPADQQVALENVLAINPKNQDARDGLGWLRRRAAAGRAPAPPPEAGGTWVPPPPLDENEVVELSCWQCQASLYSVAPFCWQCHAPVHSCNNCTFRYETRCKELQGLANAVLHPTKNTCPWWRPA